jgi:putative hemolysin
LRGGRSHERNRLLRRLVLTLLFTTATIASSGALAQNFKFSEPTDDDKADAAAAAQRDERIMQQISTPCRADLRDKKIMLVIGEQQSNGYISAHQQNYGPHFQVINSRLRSLGLRTYTPEEIRAQIKQAEIDAYFRNDPDAALAAAKRLGASFVLRGLISAHAQPNPIIAVNQVSVDMGFTLASSSGKIISDTQASAASYAGADVQKMALTLVNEKADEVVATLYSDYCRNAGYAAAARKPAPR